MEQTGGLSFSQPGVSIDAPSLGAILPLVLVATVRAEPGWGVVRDI